MSTRKLLLRIIFFSGFGAFAQDIHFSQLSMAPLQINPANTGFFDGYSRAILNYRTQWPTANANYQTIAAGFDANVGIKKTRNAFIGFGGLIFQDKTGDSQWTNLKADFMSNVVLSLNKTSKLALAIGAGVGQISANFDKLTWGVQYTGSQFDPKLPNMEPFAAGKRNFFFFDVCSGINYEINKLQENFDRNAHFTLRLGVAGYHLNQPKIIFSGLSTEAVARRFVFNAQARIDINNSPVSILPSLIYMYQSPFQQLNVGAFMRYRFKDETKTTGLKSETAIHIGCYYRVGDAIIPQFMLEYKAWMFGFSYDETLSTWKKANRGLGAFELNISWTNLRAGLFKQRREFGSTKGNASPVKYGN
ncbi:MAG TPA: PorP/SprF family type IX secretion system membrane protein [Bacteroidia bacterium]|jgi:type IX secretion system PorP/SprF family membrane protein|nr:PorP/SprF family type IX secretion system membrane protein [Bacteroidia bacterium]